MTTGCAQTSEAHVQNAPVRYKPPALPPRKSFFRRFTRCYQSVLAAETVGRCKEQGSARGAPADALPAMDDKQRAQMLAGQGDQCVHVGIVEQVVSAPESEHPQFRVHRDILRLDHHTLGDARKHGADDPGSMIDSTTTAPRWATAATEAATASASVTMIFISQR